MNDRGDAVGDLIEHLPNDAVHVRSADQDNVTVGATFAHLDGNQACRLAVPQFQIVHLYEVLCLNPPQSFPAFCFFSMAKFDELHMNFVEFHSLCRQFIVLLPERFAEC